MFAILYPLTPNLHLATLILAVVAPPAIAVWACRRWRFSLRTMLVVTTVFCVGSFFIGQDFRRGPPGGFWARRPDPVEAHLQLIEHNPIYWAKAYLLLPVLLLIGSTTVTVATMAIRKWLNRREH